MDRSNANYPRYVSVYDVLLSDIQNGVYEPGCKLPGENELAKRFNVSRNTLRQAILLLHEDGYVSNHQGKGTFVLKNHASRKISVEKADDPLTAFALDGVTKVSTDLEIRRISPKNQRIFGLDASKLLIFVKNVYYSSEERIGCGLALIPYDLFASERISLDDNEQVAGFYNELLARDDYVGESTLRVTTPRDPVDRMLGVTSSQNLLMLDEVVHDSSGAVVMTQKLFMLPSAYELTIIHRKDRTSAKNPKK